MKTKSVFNNDRGQFTIEAILIMTILTSIVLYFSQQARSNGFAAKLVEGPWGTMQGMIEDGVWTNARAAKAMHPSLRNRHVVRKGQEP